MKENEFEENINKLREFYNEDSRLTARELKNTIKNIDRNIMLKKARRAPDSVEKYAFIVLIVLIMLLGLTNPRNYFIYVFGAAFFFSGHFVGMKVKGFGLIFLFSHSVTGLCMMIAGLLPWVNLTGKSSSLAMLSDLSNNATMYIGVSVLMFVAATVLVIFYNLSDSFKNIKHSILFPLTLYLIGFAMVAFFSKVIYLI